jgi:Lysyl oxidase
VDLTLPNATWIPAYTGLSGNCGSRSALWVQEQLPLGWADTYFQTIPYQSFDISKIPNGTYYIEVIANPGHLLYETKTGNLATTSRCGRSSSAAAASTGR